MINQYLAAKDYLNIDYDSRSRAIYVTWLAPTNKELFKTGMMEVALALIHFNTTKIIWDTHQLGDLSPEIREWLANIWINEAIKAGYMYAAFYMPKDTCIPMTSAETGTCINKYARARRAAFFDNMEEAKDWLKQF